MTCLTSLGAGVCVPVKKCRFLGSILDLWDEHLVVGSIWEQTFLCFLLVLVKSSVFHHLSVILAVAFFVGKTLLLGLSLILFLDYWEVLIINRLNFVKCIFLSVEIFSFPTNLVNLFQILSLTFLVLNPVWLLFIKLFIYLLIFCEELFNLFLWETLV